MTWVKIKKKKMQKEMKTEVEKLIVREETRKK